MKIQIFVLVACSVIMTTALTPCQVRRIKAMSMYHRGSALRGTFVPKCDADGMYSALQTWPSTGARWCVNKDGTYIYDRTQIFYKSCTCTRHKLDAENGKSNGSLIPQCQENGLYKKLQCTNSHHCWRVNEKTGERLY